MASKNKKDCSRDKVVQVSFNEKEMETIIFYMKKYKIDNRSRWFRETILTHVLKNLESDYPTLFQENEMRR